MHLALLAALGLPAAASDATDGILLPGARRLETTASVGVSGAAAGMILAGSVVSTGLEGSLRLSDRLSLAGFGGWTHATLARSGIQPTRTRSNVASLVSLRVHAVDDEAIRVVPMLTLAAYWQRPVVGSLALGVAAEGGAEKLRLDLTLPSLVGLGAVLIDGEYGIAPRFVSTGFEAGVGWRLGKGHEFRLGVPSIATWRYRADHVYFELSGTFLLIAGSITAEVGARF